MCSNSEIYSKTELYSYTKLYSKFFLIFTSDLITGVCYLKSDSVSNPSVYDSWFDDEQLTLLFWYEFVRPCYFRVRYENSFIKIMNILQDSSFFLSYNCIGVSILDNITVEEEKEWYNQVIKMLHINGTRTMYSWLILPSQNQDPVLVGMYYNNSFQVWWWEKSIKYL